MEAIILISSIAAFFVAAARYGAEMRPGFDERPETDTRFGVLR